MSPALRARAAFVLRLAMAVLLLALVVRSLGGSEEVAAGLRELSVFGVVAALLANTADRVLMTWKWLLLLRARGHEVDVIDGTRIYCASMVWGMFLPATVGTDAIRAVSTVRHGVPSSEVLASIAVERALGLMASLVVALLGLLAVSLLGNLPDALAPLWWIGGLTLIGGLAVLAISFSDRGYELVHERLLGRFREQKVAAKLRDIHETYRAFGAERGVLSRFWWLSVLEQLGPVVPIWILAVDLGAEVSPLYLAGAVTLSFLVARVPVSMGGLGVMEGVLAYLLTQVGVPPAIAVATALAGRIVEVVSWLPWWLSLVLRTGSLRRPQEAEPA